MCLIIILRLEAEYASYYIRVAVKMRTLIYSASLEAKLAYVHACVVRDIHAQYLK